jgi:hypothetical protein
MTHPGFQAIEAAKLRVLAWAEAEGVPLHSIQYVATFEPWDKGVAVWVFYETDADLQAGLERGTHVRIEEQAHLELGRADYPCLDFPEILFRFDSNENVSRNYAGSMFYRMR